MGEVLVLIAVTVAVVYGIAFLQRSSSSEEKSPDTTDDSSSGPSGY